MARVEEEFLRLSSERERQRERERERERERASYRGEGGLRGDRALNALEDFYGANLKGGFLMFFFLTLHARTFGSCARNYCNLD